MYLVNVRSVLFFLVVKSQEPTNSPLLDNVTLEPTSTVSDFLFEVNSTAHYNINPNQRYLFTAKGIYTGENYKNISANITWTCTECPDEYVDLTNDLENITKSKTINDTLV